MPHRVVIAHQLSELFSVLSHPLRIRIIIELRSGELCVNSLKEILEISHSAASQHLAILRVHRLIKETKRGRQVFYRLSLPKLAAWIVDAIPFVLPDNLDSELLNSAAAHAMEEWSDTKEKLAK
ncbi:MAG: metalloregulator ArsR/SmtB family transcription factor [Candidatus Obscuribacterales bacterium]|nr:metalloregulator ArsR/SmtB family transcription factor [Candidatus Obscuribacterales bacterium]